MTTRTLILTGILAAPFLLVGCGDDDPMTAEERARLERRPVPTETRQAPGTGADAARDEVERPDV